MLWILAAAPLMFTHPGGFDHLPGVAGADPRQAIDVNTAPFRDLVRVQTELGARCTGFLIAPDQVATAAHCLFRRNTRQFVQPGSVHVLLGYQQGAYAAQAVVLRYRVGPGYDPQQENRTAGADWAVLTLPTPIGGADRILPLQTTPFPAGSSVMLAGYGMDRQERADADRACAVTGATIDAERRPLLTHTCNATLGTSGAPLLLQRPDGSWSIIGVQLAAVARGAGGAAIPIGALIGPAPPSANPAPDRVPSAPAAPTAARP